MPVELGQPFSNMQPYVAVTFATPIGGEGIYPGSGVFGNTLGFIYGFAGNYAPSGGYRLEGQLVDIASDDTTFSVIGTTYGGDGITEYAMPDLQGRAIIGDGTGTGLSSYTLGNSVGVADISLTQQEIPPDDINDGMPFSTVQPSLPLNRLICVSGAFPTQGGASADATFLGQIATFAGTDIPEGWIEAAGQLLPMSTNQALFAILGTTFGGNGTTHFQLPNLRSRVSVGANADHPLGVTFGQESVAVALENLPPPSGADLPVNNEQPSLALNYLICTSGSFPQHDPDGAGFSIDQGVFGQIVEFAGNFAPSGWAFCDGSILPIAGNTALFSILGTTYGGNGISNFALPDLRGRTLIGAGTNGSNTYFVGDTGGSDAIVLSANNLPAPCFVAGTRILTARGDVAVEMLVEGDQVFTTSGVFRAVRWIGHRTLSPAHHPRPWDVQPIRIAANAFGPGAPRRDVWLSPDHAVFTAGVLIPVRYLLNGATIGQENVRSVTYFHVELADAEGAAVHDVLLAEGLACESFLDTGNRGAFANGGTASMLHADFALSVWETQSCAKLVRDGSTLIAVRAALLDRAVALGHAMTTDPELHLLVDGVVIWPVWDGDEATFDVPAAARRLQLGSRIAVSAHMKPADNDTRELGVAVSRLMIGGVTVPLDDPVLNAGWHLPERDWRWTRGMATLPSAPGAVISVTLLPLVHYWQRPALAA